MKSLAEEKIELDALLQEVKSAKRLMDEAEKKCKETDKEVEDFKLHMQCLPYSNQRYSGSCTVAYNILCYIQLCKNR